jgi:hypothetical protein
MADVAANIFDPFGGGISHDNGEGTLRVTIYTMKINSLCLIVSMGLLLSSCIPSVNPFYTSRDVLWQSRLLGEWRPQDTAKDAAIWQFEPGDGKSYQVTIRDKDGKQGKFKAFLFQLRKEQFLDLFPADCDYATNQLDLVGASMFAGHLLVRVQQREPELRMAFFDFEWLEKFLAEHPRSLAHHREDKGIVLTAETRALQAFVMKHVGEGELFQKPDVYRRSLGPAEPSRP